MSSIQPSTPEEKAKIDPPIERSWLFTVLFGSIGFVLGGGIVFYYGFRAFAPPLPPPGTASCGNEVLGGLLVMVFGTPIGAFASSIAGALSGCLVDFALFHRKKSRIDARIIPPESRRELPSVSSEQSSQPVEKGDRLGAKIGMPDNTD
ncbi:MAG: hypothetical protein IT426_20305 [Pirellulales bacterium]|nr:hypothetical protein [Pirellulales bacterium]